MSAERAGGSYQFGIFKLDVSKRVLYRSGEFVPVTPKVLETLLVLVEQAGQVVTKEEVLQRVWPDAFVEEGSISNNIFTLRKILNPHFEGQSPILTVARRGYRFTAEVVWHADEVLSTVADPPPDPVEERVQNAPVVSVDLPSRAGRGRAIWVAFGVAGLALVLGVGLMATRKADGKRQHRPVIAVLKIENLSSEPDTWIALALQETLGSELSSGGNLRAIPAESVAEMQRDLSIDSNKPLERSQMNAIAQRLRCDFVLAGSYLLAGGKMRLDVQLTNLATGESVNSSVTDRADKLLDVVSSAGSNLRAGIGVAPLPPGEAAATHAAMSVNTDANRYYFEGLAAMRLRDGPHAQEMLSKAIEADPDFALAHSALSNTFRILGYDVRGAAEAKRAFELSGKLRREDQLLIEAQYYEASSKWQMATEKYQALWNFFPDNIEYALKVAETQWRGDKNNDSLRTIEQLKAKAPASDSDPRIGLIECTVVDIIGDHPRAVRVAEETANKASASGITLLLARARLKQGVYAEHGGKYEEAHRFFAESRQLFQSAGENGGVADATRFDAEATYYQGDFEKAKAELDSALALTTRMAYIRLTTEIQFQQSLVWRRMGKISEAAAAAEAALRSAQEAANLEAESRAFNSIGLIAKSQGQYTKAREMFTEGSQAARGAANENDYLVNVNSLAVLDLMQGRLSEARARLEEILPIDRKLGRPVYTGLHLDNLSRVRFHEGDLEAAEQFNREGCQILQSIKAKAELAICHIHQVEIDLAQGRIEEARSTVESLVSEVKATAVVPGELANLAILQVTVGNAGQAIQSLEMARKTLQSGTFAPEDSVGVAIAEARIENAASPRLALSKLARAQSDAQKFGLTLRSFEARLSAAEIQSRQGNNNEAAKLEREASDAGLSLFASKARNVGSATLRASGSN